jgi:uncharacterized protein YbdZ (MbtH family)
MKLMKSLITISTLAFAGLTGCGGVEPESLQEETLGTAGQAMCTPSSDLCGTSTAYQWPAGCPNPHGYTFYCQSPTPTACLMWSCEDNQWTTMRNMDCADFIDQVC